MPIINTIKTWICPDCGYTAPGRIDPYSSRFLSKYKGVQPGGCPSCATHPTSPAHHPLELLEGTDLSGMVTTSTITDEEAEAEEKHDLDQNGNYIMIQTGEKEVLAIQNGSPVVVTEPVYEPKMRELTDQELADLKEQRDRNLDELEKLAA